MVFTVFTGSVELAFRSHCDFEGLVEQSVVFTVSSKAQSSWLIEVTAILKAQSSKAWCFQVSPPSGPSGSSTQAGDYNAKPNI